MAGLTSWVGMREKAESGWLKMMIIKVLMKHSTTKGSGYYYSHVSRWARGRQQQHAEVSGLSPQFVRCAYVIILMAIYWCTEVIPLAVTSLMPALLFPLFKILDSKQVSRPRAFLLLPVAHSPSPSLSGLGPLGTR